MEVEYDEGQGDQEGSKGSGVLFPSVANFPGDGAVQWGLEGQM